MGPVLVEHARSDIGHLNHLASLRPGQRPQIQITENPGSARKTFTITIYGNPAGGYFSFAWKPIQAAERRFWYKDSTRKDLENLAVFLNNVNVTVQDVVTQKDLETLRIFHTALQSFQEQGFQNYLTSCCEGLPNAKPIAPEEKRDREQKARELREQLNAAAAKVKQALDAAGVKAPEIQGELSGDQKIRQGYLFLHGSEHVQLTENKVEVAIIHLKADCFLKTIEGWGRKFVSLVTSAHTFPAIELAQPEEDFYKKLQNAGLLGVWTSFDSGTKTYLVNRLDYKKIRNFLTYHGIDASRMHVVERAAPAPCAQPSTVVLKGGINSTLYSLCMAQEAAAFLSQGYNVVLFEDKYPKRFQLPSRDQVQQTVRAVYSFLTLQGLSAKNIMWKGTSLGAISAMVGAAFYPGTLGFADQGFATLTETATDYVRVMTSTRIPEWMIRPFVHHYLNYSDKNFDAETVIPLVSGPFCILNNKHDGFIQPTQSEKLASLAASNKGKVLAMDNAEMHHAEGWFKDPDATAQVLRFLTEAGFAPAPIL